MPNNLVVVTKNAYAVSNTYKFQMDPYLTNKKNVSLDISFIYISEIFIAQNKDSSCASNDQI